MLVRRTSVGMEGLLNFGEFVRLDFGVDVDFEYEFDAFRYFDFCREETCVEAREAEMWFERARGYGHSPLVAKGSSGNNFLTENINVSPKLKKLEIVSEVNASSHIERGTTSRSGVDDGYKGWTTDNHMDYEYLQPNCKTVFKVPPFKCSTLMKPTASQLAKKNWIQETPRRLLPKPPACNHLDQFQNGNQAPKRQKLEGGHMQKLQQMIDAKQDVNLTHKISHTKKEDVSVQSRVKLTVPREPELQTTRRARLIRLRSYQEQQENICPTTYVFKACPLNKKILEAPSLPLRKRSIPRPPEFQEFHLKTAERAVHHQHATNHSFTSNFLAGAERVKRFQYQASRLFYFNFTSSHSGHCHLPFPSVIIKIIFTCLALLLDCIIMITAYRMSVTKNFKDPKLDQSESISDSLQTKVFKLFLQLTFLTSCRWHLSIWCQRSSLSEIINSQTFQSSCKVSWDHNKDIKGSS